jgi:hypothetical protein
MDPELDCEDTHVGDFRLYVEVGSPDDGRLLRTLQAVWEFAGAEASSTGLGLDKHSHGVVRLPNSKRVVCSAWNVRGEEFVGTSIHNDWLVFGMPMSAIAKADPRVDPGYPFGDDDSTPWRRPLECWLARVALKVLEVVPFQLVLIGFDALAEFKAAQIAVEGIPAERLCSILTPGPPPAYYPATY